MKALLLPAILLISQLISTSVYAEHRHHSGPDAPVGIMGSHLHPEGEWMVSYNVMQMQMDGNRDGNKRVDTPLPGYMVSPLKMEMTMHMLSVMTGYTENMTLMLMLPVNSISMDHIVNMSGVPFTTEASGIGDLGFSVLFKTGNHWISRVGLSLPTGSIDEEGGTPMSGGQPVQLPYPMQLGSGSYELLAGATYSQSNMESSWGTQADISIKLDDNDRDYRLGNRLGLTAWYSYGINEKNSTSIRVKIEDWGNISGDDAELNPMMVPTADAKLRAGTRADFLLGYNYQISSQYLFGLEVAVPFYQKLDGPQLETDLSLQLGLQFEF